MAKGKKIKIKSVPSPKRMKKMKASGRLVKDVFRITGRKR